MAVITFIATRSIAAGYTLGQTVTFALDLVRCDTEQKLHEKTHTTRGGRWQRRIKYLQTHWQVQTIHYGDTPLALLTMFAESVKLGEPFDMDPVAVTVGGATLFYGLSMQAPAKRLRDRVSSDFAISFSALEVV